MYSLNNLPIGGVVRVYATAEHVTDESAEFGDAEERGWVNRIGSRDIFESRNDVRPLFEARVVEGGWMRELDYRPTTGTNEYEAIAEADTEALDALRTIVSELGAYETDDGSTLYAADAEQDYELGGWYGYAIHAHVKHHRGGWIEDAVDIVSNRL